MYINYSYIMEGWDSANYVPYILKNTLKNIFVTTAF